MDSISHSAGSARGPLPRAGFSQGGGAALEKAARDFESVFVFEMLKASGVGRSRTSFGGGAGEDAFASMLTREYAAAIVDRGGLGLAASIREALARGPKGGG